MNNQIVTVNLIPDLSAPAVVRVSQYDVGRPLTIRVLDGTGTASFSSSVTATIVGTKPSGLGFTQSGLITGNTVTLNTTLAMTQECGMIPAEISFTTALPATVIGTANFILAVEPSPHPDGTTDGTQETMASLETRLQGEIDALDTRVDALEAGQGSGSGLTDDVKTALLQIAQKVAYIDANGQDYYDDLYDALYNDTTRSVLLVLSHVSSSNAQSTVEVGDSYTTTLTASTNYTLNSVTVTMGGVDVTSTTYSSGTVSIPSVTGNVVITATAVLAAQSITATYTQSGTVYDTDSLDSLKADLVVTANYSGGTSETVPASDYTLSGALTVGTSTITVNYAGLTDTFDVTVTNSRYTIYDYIYNTRSSGASSGDYVLTDLTHSPSFNTLNVEFEAMNSNSSSASDGLFCANNQDTSDTGNMVWYSRASKAGFSAYNLGVAKQLPSVPADTRAIIKYFFVDGGESYMQWDNTTVAVATMAKSAVAENNIPLVLAGGYSFSTGNLYGLAINGMTKLGYVKFSDPTTGNVLYHFMPAYDNTASKYGYYEAINHVFYPIHNNTLRCGNWS